MRFSQLDGRRIALWGFGREGRAAWMAWRRHYPGQPLTVFCPPAEHPALAALDDPLLHVRGEPQADDLAAFEVVIKSPGISAYSPVAEAARAAGVELTSGTALWFAEPRAGRTLCVTGTKGKSTTTALIAHLLRAGGHRVALAGNIGLPLLELLDVDAPPEFWVVELSSYQTRDARSPDVAVVLNLFPEHLDWHGSEARYVADKLALVTAAAPDKVVLNARDPRLRALAEARSDIDWFDDPHGWHLREEWLFRADEPIVDTATMPLPGRHNRVNLCAALAAIEALGLDARPLARHAASFRPLPHRLQRLGRVRGLEYVDDSISTTPHAALAALDCFPGRRIALLLGGYDRGLDWQAFAERMRRQPPVAIVTMGQNGPRIHALLADAGIETALSAADSLEQAVAQAVAALDGDGLVLLSPGAPSFPTFRDYAERGRRFAALAGFDADAADSIPGLGIA